MSEVQAVTRETPLLSAHSEIEVVERGSEVCLTGTMVAGLEIGELITLEREGQRTLHVRVVRINESRTVAEVKEVQLADTLEATGLNRTQRRQRDRYNRRRKAKKG